MGSILWNNFEATLRSKKNDLNVLKKRFSLSGKVLNEEVKNVFWENQAKALKMFSSWVYEVKHFRKWFWSYFRPKTNILNVWKLCFSFVCTFLNDEVETLFRKSKAKPSKLYKFNVGHRKYFRKWFWSCLEMKTNVLKI